MNYSKFTWENAGFNTDEWNTVKANAEKIVESAKEEVPLIQAAHCPENPPLITYGNISLNGSGDDMGNNFIFTKEFASDGECYTQGKSYSKVIAALFTMMDEVVNHFRWTLHASKDTDSDVDFLADGKRIWENAKEGLE